jgi:glycosyltransferase involved in cell wall biosynthesis
MDDRDPWFVHLSLYGAEPVDRSRFLAAAKKNRRILEAAARAGMRLVVVDTSCVPQPPGLAPELAPLAARGRLRLIRFPGFGRPALARLLILLWLPITMLKLHAWLPRHRDGQGRAPVLFSFYNPMASETIPMIMARLLRPGAARILFYDDALFARHKVDLRLRSVVDQIPWLIARHLPTDVFAVNQRLLGDLKARHSRTSLLPCLVESQPATVPRRPCTSPLRLLYAGGLKQEKGIPLLLQLAGRLPPGVELAISGKGPMQETCAKVATVEPALTFHGCLSEEAFQHLQNSCSTLISLHAVMEGVFPFKLIDAIHSGMAVISGPVQSPDWLGEHDGLFILSTDAFANDPVGATIRMLPRVQAFLEQRSAASLAATRRRMESHCSVSVLSERLRAINHR